MFFHVDTQKNAKNPYEVMTKSQVAIVVMNDADARHVRGRIVALAEELKAKRRV